MKFVCTRSLKLCVAIILICSCVCISNAKSAGCPVSFSKVGCYRDLSRKSNLLFEDRRNIDWERNNWNGYISGLACQCAKAAKNAGFTYFGLQFYAECWSDVNLGLHYTSNGPSSNCTGNDYETPCTKSSPICVGQEFTNYIYTIMDNPTVEDCKDSNESCSWYKDNGYCIEDFPAVREVCKASCDLC